MGLDGMSERLIGANSILILSSYLGTLDDSCFFQLTNDSLDGALRDPDGLRDFAQDHIWVLVQQNQYM